MPVIRRAPSFDVRVKIGEGEQFSLSSYRNQGIAKSVENYATQLLYGDSEPKPWPESGLPALSEKRKAYIRRRIELLKGPDWAFNPSKGA